MKTNINTTQFTLPKDETQPTTGLITRVIYALFFISLSFSIPISAFMYLYYSMFHEVFISLFFVFVFNILFLFPEIICCICCLDFIVNAKHVTYAKVFKHVTKLCFARLPDSYKSKNQEEYNKETDAIIDASHFFFNKE